MSTRENIRLIARAPSMLMSLTELYLQQIKFHAETTPAMECFYEYFLVTNIEENPTAHATFS